MNIGSLLYKAYVMYGKSKDHARGIGGLSTGQIALT